MKIRITSSIISVYCLISSMLSAQFVIYNPPTNFTIKDMEYSGSLSRLVVASDTGVFFFDENSWIHTTMLNGLPSNTVNCIETASSGLVLAGTMNGLARWDGAAWNSYQLNTSQSFSFVTSIYVHSTNDTVYGTNNGKLFIKNVSPTAWNVTFSPPIGFFTHIGSMMTVSNDFIIGTSLNGAVIYDRQTTQTFVVSTISTPIPSNIILSHAIEGNKSYDGTDQGVYIPDFTAFPSNVASVVYNTSNSPLPSNIIQSIAVRNGAQWYGTPNGLAELKGTTWKIYTVTNSNLPDDNIVDLDYDTLGNILWVGTGDGKVSKLDVNVSVDSEIDLENGLYIFPNPSSDNIMISLVNMYRPSYFHYSIYAIDGKRIERGEFLTPNIHIKNLISGIYMINIYDEGMNVVTQRKIVITN